MEVAILVAVIAGNIATLGMFLQLNGRIDKVGERIDNLGERFDRLNDRLIDHVLQKDAHR
jgi:hypothetical protein